MASVFSACSAFLKRYPHWKLFAYWIVYGICFELLEWLPVTRNYHVMYCQWDDRIPFLEIFIIPYLFWFVFLIGIHVYTFFKDPPAFRKLMRFIMVSYSLSVLIFFLYPSMQNLRPETMPRDNVLTDMVAFIYGMDTNTNVCPSLHVVGSMAVLFTSWQCKPFQKIGWRIGFWVAAVLISISTIFLKQHSLIDLPVAVAVCLVAYPIAFGKFARRPALHHAE